MEKISKQIRRILFITLLSRALDFLSAAKLLDVASQQIEYAYHKHKSLLC